MLVVPDARVAKDTVPVTVDFLDMRARKLSMDESKAEVYSLDPKIDARLPLWVGVPVHVDVHCFCYVPILCKHEINFCIGSGGYKTFGNV